jgi:predicted metal-dependent hydrolase
LLDALPALDDRDAPFAIGSRRRAPTLRRAGERVQSGVVVSDDPLREAVLAAAREFNAGRYFEAHEALEDALDDVPEESWTLFLGLIQVAVGYHKVTQDLLPGARRMLEIGLEKLAPHADDAGGIELGALRDRAHEDLAALRAGSLDAARLAERPPRLVPRPTSRVRPRA